MTSPRSTSRLRAALESRTAIAIGVAVSLVVPALTLPRLPQVSLWPVLAGLLPWVVGKYLLCPLRWRALTDAGLSRRWHLRAYAESELLGLLTPGARRSRPVAAAPADEGRSRTW